MVQSFGALALAAAMNARQVSTIFISYLSLGDTDHMLEY